MSKNTDTPVSSTLDAILNSTGRARANALQTETYTKIIRRLRIILPLLAIGIIAVVFTWDTLDNYQTAPREITAEIRDNVKNELISPRYQGVDEKNRPFTVTADLARQSNQEDDFIALENPQAKMKLDETSWIALRAASGNYNQENQVLLLREDVMLFNDRGFRLNTAFLEVDIDQGLATAETSVTAEGPDKSLQAAGMRGNLQENHLFFTGPAVLTLHEGRNE